ncbi:MAG: hypothetical protein KJI70_02050 [Patescibacteria group bacterium]|nr:hypothetical protein [Patescibacteria group bacterium]
MKKVFLSLIAITSLTVLVVPMIVSAQPVTGCEITHTEVADFESACTVGAITDSVDAWGMCCLLNTVYTVVDWIFFGLIAVVSLFTILGAFDILTAAGDPEKVKKGRERIMYAMIGLAVALLSRAVPSIVVAIVG